MHRFHIYAKTVTEALEINASSALTLIAITIAAATLGRFFQRRQLRLPRRLSDQVIHAQKALLQSKFDVAVLEPRGIFQHITDMC